MCPSEPSVKPGWYLDPTGSATRRTSPSRQPVPAHSSKLSRSSPTSRSSQSSTPRVSATSETAWSVKLVDTQESQRLDVEDPEDLWAQVEEQAVLLLARGDGGGGGMGHQTPIGAGATTADTSFRGWSGAFAPGLPSSRRLAPAGVGHGRR